MLQPTFGYLLGFALQAWFCGKYARRLRTISFRSLLAVNAGRMAIVYILGIGWFYLMSNYVLQAPIAFWAAIFYCGILQAGPDFLLCMAAAGLALRCYKAGLWLAMPTAAGREQVEVKEADHGQSIIHHGTGTDIGKTYVTGLIVKKLREAGLEAGITRLRSREPSRMKRGICCRAMRSMSTTQQGSARKWRISSRMCIGRLCLRTWRRKSIICRLTLTG